MCVPLAVRHASSLYCIHIFPEGSLTLHVIKRPVHRSLQPTCQNRPRQLRIAQIIVLQHHDHSLNIWYQLYPLARSPSFRDMSTCWSRRAFYRPQMCPPGAETLARSFFGTSFTLHRGRNLTPSKRYDQSRLHPLYQNRICLALEPLSRRCRLCYVLRRLLAWRHRV